MDGAPEVADRTPTGVAVGKAIRRLLPLLVLLYIINYVDRVNIGFAAASTFNADLGLSAAAYGLGAGLFFIGYFLFEVPSNVILHKVGARLWIARIMITWGLVATSTAFIQGEISFYVVRVLLGIAEAGFFPGIILYLTYWFPRAQRAKIVALFFMAVPLSSVLGSPISALLIQNGAGTLGFAEGWRFMFFVEGIPAVLLGIVVIFLLPSKPRNARWLTTAEATALETTIAAEDAQTVEREVTVREALTNVRVLALSTVYFGVVFGLYVLGFFLPTVIKGFGTQFGVKITLLENGLITAIPYAVATVAMFFWSRHSDARQERAWHVALPAFVGAAGIIGSIYMNSPVLVMVFVTICTVGVFTAIPVFWQLPNAFLTGVGAAAGIALINSFGNLAGFAGPYLTGLLKDLTGSIAPGLWVVAGFMVLSGIIVLALARQNAGNPVLAPAGEPAAHD
ncbi:MFS transporter [Pseudonocardia sp. CA-107938]|uniref:MFS transporter n=1 Tax=Pseudonocardia sp. CA-107938 TaxID=3240021 RepID=UPI003D92C8A2